MLLPGRRRLALEASRLQPCRAFVTGKTGRPAVPKVSPCAARHRYHCLRTACVGVGDLKATWWAMIRRARATGRPVDRSCGRATKRWMCSTGSTGCCSPAAPHRPASVGAIRSWPTRNVRLGPDDAEFAVPARAMEPCAAARHPPRHGTDDGRGRWRAAPASAARGRPRGAPARRERLRRSHRRRLETARASGSVVVRSASTKRKPSVTAPASEATASAS